MNLKTVTSSVPRVSYGLALIVATGLLNGGCATYCMWKKTEVSHRARFDWVAPEPSGGGPPHNLLARYVDRGSGKTFGFVIPLDEHGTAAAPFGVSTAYVADGKAVSYWPGLADSPPEIRALPDRMHDSRRAVESSAQARLSGTGYRPRDIAYIPRFSQQATAYGFEGLVAVAYYVAADGSVSFDGPPRSMRIVLLPEKLTSEPAMRAANYAASAVATPFTIALDVLTFPFSVPGLMLAVAYEPYTDWEREGIFGGPG